MWFHNQSKLDRIIKLQEKLMAAIDDLNTAVTNLTAAIQAGVSQINTEMATIQGEVDQSPAIETAVANINTVTASLTAAVTAAQTALGPKTA